MSCGELASQGGQPSHSSCRSKYHVTLLLEKKAWIFFDLVRFDLHSTEICSFKVWMFLMFETLGLDLRCCSGLRALWRVYQLAVETDPGHLTTLKPVLVRVLECCTFSLLFFDFGCVHYLKRRESASPCEGSIVNCGTFEKGIKTMFVTHMVFRHGFSFAGLTSLPSSNSAS